MKNIFLKNVIPISIEKELKRSYIDYALSVIISRALPDVRDGLKPVHRRILYAMNRLKNFYDKHYKKSARIVGEVIGKYHPHGDNAVYESIVRLAQSFSLRYPLIDGQGNFGSVDGDSAAAMRYTEIRMSKIAHEMLKDLDKNTVDFMPNYDNTTQIPIVLPTKIPNLLINGCSGIAVGMATNIPPHNFTEIINGCLAYIENNSISIEKLMEYVPGPDFPTGAIIKNNQGLLDAYKTGKGKIIIQSRYRITNDIKNNRTQIVFFEIPYQINKSKLIEKISYLIKNKKLEGISNIRDESDKDGLRIAVELKKDVDTKIVINQLYNLTNLQISFYINMVALYLGKPKLMNLKEIISTFIEYRCEVLKKSITYDLNLAKERLHLLEGYIVIIPNIENVINLIKKSENIKVAQERLLSIYWSINNKNYIDKDLIESDIFKESKYNLSKKQISSILELKIYKLNNLEFLNIIKEYKILKKKILYFNKVLNNNSELFKILKKELVELKNNFGDKRLTTIDNINDSSIFEENLNNFFLKKKIIVSLSNNGYIKSILLSDYVIQHRGGKGKIFTKIKELDSISKILVTNTHKVLLCFSNLGRVYLLQLRKIPITKSNLKGKPIINFVLLKDNEKITNILSIKPTISQVDRFIVMVTAKGIIKKTPLIDFYNYRKNGFLAIDLNKKDKLVGVKIAKKNSYIMLLTAFGKAVRFKEESIRVMGKRASGMRGIKLNINDYVVSLIILEEEKEVITVTENGYGKRTFIEEYPLTKRATKGVTCIKINKRNGLLISSLSVKNKEEVMLVTNSGSLLRINVEEISLLKRNTQGVKLIKTNKNVKLVDAQRIVK